MFFLGGNPAEAHPVSLQHLLEGKELNTREFHRRRSAAHAHGGARDRIRAHPARHRYSGDLRDDLAHLQNGWEDKEFIAQRVYGMDDVRKEVEKWTPEEVERVTGVPAAQLKRVAEMFAKEKPATLIWCMGQTQHTVGTANVRASCILLLATGNVGRPGRGANIFRGHDNVQGATDVGLDIVTLPFYYGLPKARGGIGAASGKSNTTGLQSQFDSKKMMETPGHSADPLVRRGAAAKGPGRSKRQYSRHVRAGACQQQHHAHS